MYINTNTEGKEVCRDIIDQAVNTVRKTNKKISVFTLPSTNFLLEDRLAMKFGTKLYTAEYKKDIYEEQLTNPIYKRLSKDGKIVHKLGDAFTILREIPECDVVWLDLCCTLELSIINRWLSFVQSSSTKQQYIALTVMGKRGFYAPEIVKFYNCKNMEQFRNKVFPALTKQFAKIVGIKCKMLKMFKYEGENNCPMLFYLFQLN
jgi:hypothetical protein